MVDSCPMGAVQKVARNALDAARERGAEALPEQAFFVLTAVRGWQGPRANQVKTALEEFLAPKE